ncbi:MAG: type IX secretion system membrane protein PorP/SprF [Sphingobacteriales bacterium]|uniref:PorP/SprF family type IX secretion system membrane protein n=1 Tax=Hydrotalea flava TaxID=714549 RepID=UPI000835BAED|nr:type IX secretion system membrane protein PorP/SprF [Hydrotalea flava]RTL56622.1 MAG: type IX secretion system membrane protein PorP/SprF [Sphingobacteriales bacterium]
MKLRLFILVVFPFFFVATSAQQRPYYTQYILNNFIINPAVAGIENYTDVKLSHRIQWEGLTDAPVTTYFTIQGPLHKSSFPEKTATGYHTPGENPRGNAYWRNYTSAPAHAGVGLTILNDKFGSLNRFAAYATYAYHVGLTPNTNLSAGISAGISQLSLNTSNLNFAVPVDPAVANANTINRIKPDISAGLWLYAANYFLGLSAQQIIPDQIYFSNHPVGIVPGKLVPHLFFTAGYRYSLSDDISALPSFQIRYIQPLPLGIDVNVKLQYQDLLWAGTSLRYKNGFAAMLGINLNQSINISYSYDYTTSALGTVSSGTHEILIGFLLNNRYADWCPRRLW